MVKSASLRSQGGQAVNHIGDSNKKVSDTPISDSTPHNVADLGMLCRRLERELNAANERINRLEEELIDVKNKHSVLIADVVLDEDRGERINRLEEENDAMRADLLLWEEKEVK